MNQRAKLFNHPGVIDERVATVPVSGVDRGIERIFLVDHQSAGRGKRVKSSLAARAEHVGCEYLVDFFWKRTFVSFQSKELRKLTITKTNAVVYENYKSNEHTNGP